MLCLVFKNFFVPVADRQTGLPTNCDNIEREQTKQADNHEEDRDQEVGVGPTVLQRLT